MKSFIKSALVASVLFSTATLSAQSANRVSGTDPRPQVASADRVSGTDPRPQYADSNRVSGTDPRPQIADSSSVVSAFLSTFGISY